MKAPKSIFRKIAILGLISFSFMSCDKLLEEKPIAEEGKILPEEAVETGEDLQQLLNSAYDVLANAYNGNVQNPVNLLGDNLIRPVSHEDYTSVWLRNTNIFNGTLGKAFKEYNIAILRSNTVLENLDKVSGLSANDRDRIEAEARFIRGLCHFDLVRSWAQPYGYTANNSHPGIAIRTGILPDNAPRESVAAVYEAVLNDVVFAKGRLPESNSVYATKWSATALEAEIRFQQHDYHLANQLANQVIVGSSAVFDSQVNKYQFPQASPEALFYIFSAINPNTGSVDNRNSPFRDNYNSDNNPNFRIAPDFYNLLISTGEALPRSSLYLENDQDGNITYMTNMMNNQSFNVPVFTITQMMLIRAESAAEAGLDLTDGINDINAIRERAYSSNITNLLPSANAEEVIEAARLERRMEFPCNGQRTHDLKRMGAQGEDIMIRDVPWDCNGMILQFPSTEGTDLFELNPGGGC